MPPTPRVPVRAAPPVVEPSPEAAVAAGVRPVPPPPVTPMEVLPPPPREEPAPPAPVEPEFDEAAEERHFFIIQMLATGKQEPAIVREVVRTFAVTRDQARKDFEDAKGRLRQKLDDEGAIDAVAWGALANIQMLRERFTRLAMQDVPDKIREVPGSDPDDPDRDAIYRKLTPAEHAAAVGARAAAAKVALSANEMLVKIAGRRSTRWAERPQNVVITTGGGGLSDDEKAFLKSIGVMK